MQKSGVQKGGMLLWMTARVRGNNMNEGDIVLFHEHQSLAKARPWVLIASIICVVGTWYWLSILSDETMRLTSIIAGLAFLGVLALNLMTSLDTVVTSDELRFQYRPVHLSPRVVPKAAIISAHAEVYRSLATYSWWGVWGISIRHGITSYTMSGNKGVYVTYHTKQGKKTILIGSQKADALQQALQKN